jgi:single-stranded-DNA-specific exonuclease
MTGENRALSYFGLQVINQHPRPGFKAIINQLKKKELTITDVVFIIAPRINAAGRMKHGQHAVDLLTEDDLETAISYAEAIEAYNVERRELDRKTTIEALDQIQLNGEEDRFTSVVYQDHWHKGVIGIVASRLTETYYRPTLVFTKSGDKLAASARSVKGFDVYNALEGCSDFIEQFGGHKYAAGLTLEESQYKLFKEKFEDVVSKTIDPILLTPEISVDALISLHQITPRLVRILKQFAPFGPGNMRPVFMAEHLQDSGYGKRVGETKDHLKLDIVQDQSQPIAAIGFNIGAKYSLVENSKTFNAVFSIEENTWNGNTKLQLKLRDLQ